MKLKVQYRINGRLVKASDRLVEDGKGGRFLSPMPSLAVKYRVQPCGERHALSRY